MLKTSNSIRLTDPFIRSLAKVATRVEYSDTQQVGLRLRASPGGKLRFAFKGRHSDGKTRTVTIGDYPAVSLKLAREKAAEIRREVKDGIDPTEEKRRKRQSAEASEITLAALVDEYEAYAAPKRKIWQKSVKGRAEARRRIECVFGPILQRPVEKITPEDLSRVMQKHIPRASHPKATAKLVPGASVVKAFNTIFAQHYATGLKIAGQPLQTFVAADDATAKETVLRLAADLGLDPVDAGPLKNARYLEPLGFLNIQFGYVLGRGTEIAPQLMAA